MQTVTWLALLVFLFTYSLISIRRVRSVSIDRPAAALFGALLMILLGVVTADQVLDLMRERGQAEGAAFVIATHDERLTRRCDRVVALLDGRIQ